MNPNPYAASLETRILSATPVELVQMLYDAAVDSVESARQHLAQGRIVERGRAVTKAVEILTELYQSLDRQNGGDLSARLAALYDYLQRILLDANYRQTDDGLAEAERLLKTLREAWAQISVQAAKPPASAAVLEPALAGRNLAGAFGIPEYGTAAHQWSA